MSSDGEKEDFDLDGADYDDDAFDGNVLEGQMIDSASEPDDFDVLSPTVDTAPPKKLYDVVYNVYDLKQIVDMQNAMIEDVEALLAVSRSNAATLLRHFAWNVERLQETFWNDPDATLLSAGLSPQSSPLTSSQPLPNIFECPICFADYEGPSAKNDTFALSCGHRFCKNCWREYLTGKIKDDSESSRIQCMESGCKRLVREEMIGLLAGQHIAKRYKNLLSNAFVQDSPNLRWCPHPDCEYIIGCAQAPPRMLTMLVPTVMCRCGKQLCFGCGYSASHRPVICTIVKFWEKKCADDSETANWLQANTKECPKCGSTIEKSGGCKNANTNSAGSVWAPGKNMARTGINVTVMMRSLVRMLEMPRQNQGQALKDTFTQYFNRWANHEHSAKLDTEFYAKTDKKMEQMQNNGNLSWIEVQFARQAVDTVVKARITLKWSYCMAFYLKRNNQTELFEDNQRDLERAVENLSYLLEQNIGEPETIAKLRHDVTNQAAYVQKRHDILMDDTLKGYLEHRWEFTINI
nr:ariadne-1 [Cryptococcus depauperatus CBS 7855]